MTKVMMHHPDGKHQFGVNTEHICSWRMSPLLYQRSLKVAPGFSLRLFMVSGQEIEVRHDEGGKELLDVLWAQYFALNDAPEKST